MARRQRIGGVSVAERQLQLLAAHPAEGPVLGPAAPAGLGRMIAGGRGAGGAGMVERRALDFYPTPGDVTAALLRVERNAIAAAARGGPVWEPCGRGGAPTMECAWMVWQRGCPPPVQYHLLPREPDRGETLL